MNPLALMALALQSIRQNWLRTLLTLLGIVIGVSSVIVMTSIGQGSQQQIVERMSSLGDNLLIVTPGSRSFGGVNLGAGSAGTLDVRDVQRLQQELRSAQYISPLVRLNAQIVGGVGNWSGSVQGVDAQFPEIRRWVVATGSFFGARETQARAPVAVLGDTVVRELFPDRDPVGERIRIGNVPFTVVGTLQAKGSSAFGGDQDDVVFVPWTAAQARLTGRLEVAQVMVSAPAASMLPDLEQEVRAVIRRSHRLNEAAEDDFSIRNQTEIMSVVSETSRALTLLLGSVAAISLLVGGIGIMNMMLVAVTERTREIGLRVAVGARPRDILAQFLSESVVICVTGGLLGAAFGMLVVWVLQSIVGIAAVVRADTLIVALSFSAGVGLFFGIYPARQAARLDPIEALRYG
ncbi:MAG TPA: ABC transporter permease [Steroidobacteraceae bacterium]|nr:ABC transporter permease [Steroidobacteraceae bacterium]